MVSRFPLLVVRVREGVDSEGSSSILGLVLVPVVDGNTVRDLGSYCIVFGLLQLWTWGEMEYVEDVV